MLGLTYDLVSTDAIGFIQLNSAIYPNDLDNRFSLIPIHLSESLNLKEVNTMAFANEYLTDEAERVKYGSAHVTLDRERDAWLTRSGGGGERPEFIELHWQGEEIKMHAYEQPKKNAQSETEIDWYIAKLHIPEKLEERREEVINMVKEALIAHKSRGFIQFDDRIKKVNVEFSDHVINYKPGEPTWM